jgi:hypothetical protein
MIKDQPTHHRLSDELKIDFTSSHHNLKDLFLHADRLGRLEQIINSGLPPIIRGKYKINGIHDGALTLTCRSAALATRIRFCEKQLLENLASHHGYPAIKRLKVKIRPVPVVKHLKPAQRFISHENARLLLAEAGQTKNEALKNALLKLAARANP